MWLNKTDQNDAEGLAQMDFGCYMSLGASTMVEGQMTDLINYALNKNATQSSFSKFSQPFDASRAVDGVLRNSYSFHTDLQDAPWWQVDLAASVPIREICVFNRPTYSDRANTLLISGSEDGVSWHNLYSHQGHFGGVTNGPPLEVKFAEAVSARFVRITAPGRTCLHLDQVQVFISEVDSRRAAATIQRDPFQPMVASQLLICHRISGLGDMFTQAAHCIALGRRIGRRVAIDWRRSLFVSKTNLMHNLFGTVASHPEAIPIENVFVSVDESWGYSVSQLQSIRSATYNVSFNKGHFMALLEQGAFFKKCTKGFILFTVPLMGLLPESVLQETLADFSFSEEIMGEVDQFISRYPLDDAIAIHYRHGNGEFSTIRDDDETRREIDFLIQEAFQTGGKDMHRSIFLCTDSVVSEQYFKSILGERLVVYPKRYPPENAGAMHYEVEQTETAAYENLRSALVEWQLMSRCRCLVRDRWSTFANYSTARLYVRDGSLRNVRFVDLKRLQMRHLPGMQRYKVLLAEKKRL
jgi:hypothetical protein